MNKRKIAIIIISVLALLVLVLIGIFTYINTERKDDSRRRVAVESAEEIRNRLGINLTIAATKSDAGYFIEDEDIARIDYKARNMNLTLKSSSDGSKNLTNLIHKWDFPITMTSVCTDGTEVEVVAAVAIDNPKIMKAEWYDNDLYYSMNTFDMTSREDFLQEVNKIIIEFHKEFTDGE